MKRTDFSDRNDLVATLKKHLVDVIRNAIAEGQPGFEKYKPWNKIVSR